MSESGVRATVEEVGAATRAQFLWLPASSGDVRAGLSGSSKTPVAKFMAERCIHQEEWEWARPMIIEELKGRIDGI